MLSALFEEYYEGEGDRADLALWIPVYVEYSQLVDEDGAKVEMEEQVEKGLVEQVRNRLRKGFRVERSSGEVVILEPSEERLR